MSTKLLDNVSANGSGAFQVWLGGPAQLFVKGDLDGGAITIQLSDDAGATVYAAKRSDGNDFTVADADVPDSFPISGWAQGIFVRATLAGGTSPVGVFATLRQV